MRLLIESFGYCNHFYNGPFDPIKRRTVFNKLKIIFQVLRQPRMGEVAKVATVMVAEEVEGADRKPVPDIRVIVPSPILEILAW